MNLLTSLENRAKFLASVCAFILLLTLYLPGLDWLQYQDPAVADELAPLDERALAAAIITIPVQRGANGTQPEETAPLGDGQYRMGDIAALFDIELPMHSVFTRREFRVTGAQLAAIHPQARAPTLAELAEYDEDVEIPLRELLAHSELQLPRPALHESADTLIELDDLLDLLEEESGALPVAELLAEARLDAPDAPIPVRRGALELLDDYLLRAPSAFSISLALTLVLCVVIFLFAAFGQGWHLWLPGAAALVSLIWLPFQLRAENPAAWQAEELLASLAPGYWLAALASLAIVAISLRDLLISRRSAD